MTDKNKAEGTPKPVSNKLEAAAAKKARQRAEAHEEAQRFIDDHNGRFLTTIAFVTPGRDGTPRLTLATADHPRIVEDPDNSGDQDA